MAQHGSFLPLALACSLAVSACTAPTGSGPVSTTPKIPSQEAQKQGRLNTGGNLVGLDAATLTREGNLVGLDATTLNNPVPAAAPPAPGVASDADFSTPELSEEGRDNSSQNSASDLKAGAVDDNEGFSSYLKYLQNFDWNTVESKPRALDVSERIVIRVEDASGTVVPDAEVVVVEEQSVATPSQADEEASDAAPIGLAAPRELQLRTYADGRALFHPAAENLAGSGFTLRASKNGITAQTSVKREDTTWVVKLEGPLNRLSTDIPLDLAIVLDTTGSMGGEISRFQTTIDSIVERINALPQKPNLRLGLVAYRDQDEAYVTKVSDFTNSLGDFRRALDDLGAGGGGDTPEDMESGLHDTLTKLTWRETEAVRLSFVVADAAPHTDYPQSTPYTHSMRLAAIKGIKFYPIGASGLAPEGEYVMRQLAQWTLGQYLFVTRGGDENSGGGGTASANVDQYREGRLDDIVVERVTQELRKFAGE